MAQLTAMDFRSDALSPAARGFALLTVLCTAAALFVQFTATGHAHPDETITQIGWRLARYFTILTNAMVLLSFLWLFGSRRRPGSLWIGGLAVWITITALVYHLLLDTPHSGLSFYADFGLHTLTPVLTVLWWLVFAGKRGLGLGTAIAWLAWPAAYIGYALWRGGQDGIYPYFFTDPKQVGWDGVAIWSALLGLGFLVLGLVYSWIGRRIRP